MLGYLDITHGLSQSKIGSVIRQDAIVHEHMHDAICSKTSQGQLSAESLGIAPWKSAYAGAGRRAADGPTLVLSCAPGSSQAPSHNGHCLSASPRAKYTMQLSR